MIHLVNQRFDIVTPERSKPSSPTLSPAVVTPTVATSSRPERNSWHPSTVDLSELSKLLAKNSNKKESTRPRSQLFQSSKPPSPTLSTCSAEPTFCKDANAVAPILSQQRPQLSHRPASTCSTPSQFVFKKPEYDQKYHQTHFHRNVDRKDPFVDLRRFFVNNNPVSPTQSNYSQEDIPPQSDTFANQFRQNIGGRYGTWGNI